MWGLPQPLLHPPSNPIPTAPRPPHSQASCAFHATSRSQRRSRRSLMKRWRPVHSTVCTTREKPASTAAARASGVLACARGRAERREVLGPERQSWITRPQQGGKCWERRPGGYTLHAQHACLRPARPCSPPPAHSRSAGRRPWRSAAARRWWRQSGRPAAPPRTPAPGKRESWGMRRARRRTVEAAAAAPTTAAGEGHPKHCGLAQFSTAALGAHLQHAPHLPHLGRVHRSPLCRRLRVQQPEGGGQVAAAHQRRHCTALGWVGWVGGWVGRGCITRSARGGRPVRDCMVQQGCQLC